MLLTITSTGDRLFGFINIDNLGVFFFAKNWQNWMTSERATFFETRCTASRKRLSLRTYNDNNTTILI